MAFFSALCYEKQTHPLKVLTQYSRSDARFIRRVFFHFVWSVIKLLFTCKLWLHPPWCHCLTVPLVIPHFPALLLYQQSLNTSVIDLLHLVKDFCFNLPPWKCLSPPYICLQIQSWFQRVKTKQKLQHYTSNSTFENSCSGFICLIKHLPLNCASYVAAILCNDFCC